MPKLTYWTGIWEPSREALSKEVAWLRRTLAPGSPIVSFTPQRSALLWRERVLRIHRTRWQALRAAAMAIERTGDVTHVFGGLDAAHFLLLLGRRPTIFTVAIPGAPLAADLYERVHTFVAESGPIADALLRAGIPPGRIETIHPGIDLSRYTVSPQRDGGAFRLLFASTPSELADFEDRGLWLLMDLARLRPDVEVVLLWRRWGRVQAALEAIAARNPPPNFRIELGDSADMPALYRGAHATVCAFAGGTGKSAPNSVLEGLASGRPALVTDTCGIADLVASHGAGAVTARSAAALAEGLDRLRDEYPAAAGRARTLAETHFNRATAEARYRALYARLA